MPLEEWCEAHDVRDAVSGGFAAKPEYFPLGELWSGGKMLPHQRFRGAWAARRAAIALYDGRPAIDARDRLAPGFAELRQAGPLLVRDGRNAIAGVGDPEGFAAFAEEFDQDLTDGREPRVALALTAGAVLAVAAEGRAPDEAGLTLWELADVLVELGAATALNLDGGSAGVIVADGRRRNTPRDDGGNDMELSSPSIDAIVFGSASGRERA